MKNKIAIVMAGLMLATAVAGGVFSNLKNADASSLKTEAFADNFNADVLNEEKWQTNGNVGINSFGGAIQITNGEFASAVTWMGKDFDGEAGTPLSDDYSIEFTLSRTMGASEWVAFYIGLDSFDLNFSTIGDTTGSRGNALVINNNSLVNYKSMGVIAQENGKDSAINISMKNDGTVYSLKFVCDVAENIAENKADLYLCEYDPTAEQQAYGEKKGTLTGLSLMGYFGFGSMSSGGTANIGHIRVTDADGNLLWKPEHDLADDAIDMIYGAQKADATKEFRLWNSYKDEKAGKYRTGIVAEVKLDENSSLLSKQSITADKSLINCYDVTSKVKFNEKGASFVFADGKTVLSVADKKVDEESDVVTVLTFNGTDYNLGGKLSDSYHKIQFKVKTTGEIDVLVDSVKTVTVNGVTDIEGKIGFTTAAGATLYADDFGVAVYSLRDSAEKSMAIDFTELKKNGKPYISSADWYTTGSVFANKGEIDFLNADQSAFFGTKQMYADYVVKFDLFDIAQGAIDGIEACSWIGFSVGKQSYSEDFSKCETITFAPRGLAGDKVGYMNVESIGKSKFVGDTTAVGVTENIFEDFKKEGSTHKKLNVMLVVNNRTITLYYKYDDQPDSVLAVPRVVINDVDTYGYFAICTNYYGNFAVTNVSIANLTLDEAAISDYADDFAEKRKASGNLD